MIVKANISLEGGGPRWGYLGLPGSWSHEAAKVHFGERAALQGLEPDALFTAWRQGEIEAACIPFYSSIAGPTPYFCEVLKLPSLHIVAEVVMPVRHALAVIQPDVTLESLQTLSGHPVALGEVEPWLQANLGHVKRELVQSGSGAAQRIHRLGVESHAAVTPPQAAKALGLHMILDDIPSPAANVTRWWICKAVPEIAPRKSEAGHVWVAVQGLSREQLCTYQRTCEETLGGSNVAWYYMQDNGGDQVAGAHFLAVCVSDKHLDDLLCAAARQNLHAQVVGSQYAPSEPLVSSHEDAMGACMTARG